MPNIKTIANEPIRGCGSRKPGGIYLVNDGPGLDCNRLPFPLTVCPCCGAGIKPARGWTWINGKIVLEHSKEWNQNWHCPPNIDSDVCGECQMPYKWNCPLLNPAEKVGLIWVGEQFYKTPEEFNREAALQGISRRISKIPRGLEIGKTQVWLGHRKAAEANCPDCNEGIEPDSNGALFCSKCSGTGKIKVPGVFSVFIPSRIEYIVKGDETEEQLDGLEKRGFTLIRLV